MGSRQNAKVIRAIFISFTLSCLLFGCASVTVRGKLEAFENISKQYRIAILNSDFEQAAHLVSLNPGKDYSNLNNFHVFSYTLKKLEFANDKSKATQTVEIEYYRVDSMRQKILQDIQEWIYKPEMNQWILNSKLPQFH
jgi:hypothetical protein